jgi:hypothetical protein
MIYSVLQKVSTAVWSIILTAGMGFAQNSEPLTWSAQADHSRCPVGPTALWIDAPDVEACMRFFSAGEIKSAPLVVVLLRGDRNAFVKIHPSKIPQNTIEEQEKLAKNARNRVGLPVISLARPGTYGSSGNHLRRRQKPEFDTINATLNALRERYGMGEFVLVGHSGGATAVGAMLTYGRRDLRCAIIVSGAFDLLERARGLRHLNGRREKPGRDTTGLANPYDPISYLGGIGIHPERRIVVMGDPHDTVTPFSLQEKFAENVRLLGHRVEVHRIKARAPAHHNPGPAVSLDMVKPCLRID